jgi:hypothetical protein
MSDGWVYWTDSMKVIVPTGVEDKEALPLSYRLEQNYPNPFNPTTTIKYQIPDLPAGRQGLILVTLKVYDVLGSEIAELVNEEKPIGTHTIEFDATALTSGIYFYRLQAVPTVRQAGDPSTDLSAGRQGFVETRKMMLLK